VSHNLFKIRSRKSFKRVVTCQFIKEVHLRHQFICCCVIMLKARDKRSRLLSLVNLSRKSSQIQASVPYILPCVIFVKLSSSIRIDQHCCHLSIYQGNKSVSGISSFSLPCVMLRSHPRQLSLVNLSRRPVSFRH